MYVDGGRVHVGFVRDREHHEHELRAWLRDPALLRTFDADYSEHELNRVSERLTDDLTALHAELGVNSISIDVSRNRVNVTLGEPDPQAPARAWAVLAERYGPAVEVEEGWTVYTPL